MHKPVLLKEVLDVFNPKSGEYYVDCTINGGGHTKAILELVKTSGGVLGIDWDCMLIEKRLEEKEKLKANNLILVCDNYANIEHIVAKYNFGPVAGIFFDLGFSSLQLEEGRRGFSFLTEDPLDMRYHQEKSRPTAEVIINEWDEERLCNMLVTLGEERYARKIAQRIVSARKNKRIVTTKELSDIVVRNIPQRGRVIKIHPATRTFQALRIAVNNELENLKAGLRAGLEILTPGGKMIVISFHSLEDRVAKFFFRTAKQEGLIKLISPKPITPSQNERVENPRSRSAKLRAVIKI